MIRLLLKSKPETPKVKLRPALLPSKTIPVPVNGQKLTVNFLLPEGSVKVAIHRSRRRLGQLLRAEVGQTLANAEDTDEEVRYLLHCLRP